MSQLKKGALLSYANIILVNVVGLMLTPFIIRSFGDSEYGLYTLIGSFVAYLALMDLGLNNTIVRYVSIYRAENNQEEEQKFLGITMLIYLIISVVLVFVGLILYNKLDVIFGESLSLSQLEDAKIMFKILLFNIAITLPGGTFTAICTAYGKFIFPRALLIIKYVLRAITVYIILSQGGKSISLVIIDTVFNIIVILITSYYCIYLLGVKFKFKKSDKSIVVNIFSYSIWIFIVTIVRSFQWNAGQVVIGINTNTVTVAVFAVGLMLGGYFGTFAGVINSLLLPKAAKMVTLNNTGKELTDTMIRIGRINMFLSFLILSGFFLLGKEFINLWVGNSYKESWNIALIIMFVSIINLSQSFGISILEIKKKVRFRAIGMLVSISFAVVIGYYLSKNQGIYGILIPIAIAMMVNTIINNILFIKVFNFQIIHFFKQTFLKQVVFSIIFIIVGIKILGHFSINTWPKFILAGICFSILYVFIFAILISNKEEQNLFKKIMIK